MQEIDVSHFTSWSSLNIGLVFNNQCKTVWHLSFRLFSIQVKWPAKYGCDSKLLKTFPMEQMWPSSLSVEVRVSKIMMTSSSQKKNG